MGLACSGLGALVWASPAQAQVSVTVSGPAQAANCGTVYVTNRFVNGGATVSGLWMTNELPSASYAYVPGLSTVTLPGGIVLTNAAADPDVNNGSTNLVWDFTAVVTPSAITNLLITEVFYNATNTVNKESYEWFEIYNPTTNAVVCTNWSVRDAAPGAVDTLPDFTIAPGEFVIIAGRTNAFLSVYPAYAGQLLEVADGKIGSGLNVSPGDGVFLRNAAGSNVDAVSYRGSTAAFSPAVPAVAAGHSIERNPANNDTNTRNDWADQATPNPGTGTLPTGIQNGGTITVVYAAEINCDAVSGQIFSRTGFEQPPGSPGTALGSVFLTVNEPDLVVTKTPIMQDGGYGDTVSWTVRVENTGFGGAPNVTAIDRLGPGLAFTGFSVPPTTQTATNAVWDATAIAAFTNLAPGAYADIVVTAQVASCSGLYNRADATWSCDGLAVLTNETCEDTASINETATAGIHFIDRYPSLTYALDPAPIPVNYCGGTEVTLYITNASGPDVGAALNVSGTPVLPDGWSISGANVDTNGVIQIDPLPAGTTTAVVFRIEAGGDCPISTDEQTIYFRPYYEDACGNPFFGPLGLTTATVTNEPTASVAKIMPGSVSGDDGSFPVRIELTYANFDGTEQITLTDLYPVHTNLSVDVGSISLGGVLSGNSVIWSNVTPGAGSGVVTASFDLVIGTPCGGPDGTIFNEVQATDYVDCQGCTRAVTGDGFRFPLDITYGTGCPQEPGLTGGCSFVSSKDVFPELTEVCDPVMVTHTFTAFGGTLSNWTGVTFSADLAGASGYVDTTNDVTVLIDGSNVTSYVAFSQTTPSLVLDLTGLNGSSFPSLSNITASLIIAYPVSVSVPGQYTDASGLTVPSCGTAGDEVTWNVGESRLEIDLRPIDIAGSCTPIAGRIELEMLPSPEGVSGQTARFPAYDVEVTLDLDFDGDLYSGFEYVTGSTVFSNLVDLGGTPIAAFDPAISGDQLTWDLADLGTNTGMSISYTLRKRCGNDSNAQHRATAAYNNLCGDGTDPQAEQAVSRTNGAALYAQPNLLASLQPELQFLTDTQIVNQVRIMNTCAIDAFNLRVEMRLPANVSFAGAAVAPSTVTATNVVWDFHTISNAYGPLLDTDGDGSFDDLPARELLEFWVTNNVDYCLDGSEISMSASYGCFGEACTNTPWDTAHYAAISGSLVTRATFPVENAVCEVNPVEYSVRNSGLTIDYDIQAYQTLPTGMTYVAGSSAVSINGGATNSIGDPPGTGFPGDPLTWTSAEIPLLAAMQPNDTVTIFYEVALGCDVVTGDRQFLSEGRFTDLCGNVVSNREVISVLAPQEPLLEVTKTSLLDVADLGETNVYTVTIRHDAASAADVPYLVLTDVLPAAVTFAGASVTPDAVLGQTLVWSNATLNALVGDLAAPFAVGEGTITILVTGVVNDCAASVINTATLDYGCSESDACLQASDDASIITTPRLTPPGLVSSMTLDTCGGTKTVTMTNSGASTESDILYVEYAPPGYIFTGATASGEFSSAGLTVAYSGSPVGSIATVDFSTDVASGATDAKDDIGDGLANLELGKNSGFQVVWTLASAGNNLDCLADPTDLDFEDPEQGDPSSLTSSNLVTYTDLCGEAGSATGSNSAYPGIPDLDIDLQPNSLIVNDGETIVFTLTVENNSETTDAEGIYVRVKMGAGWTNVAYLSSNIVSSGATAMDYELQGDTNLLFDFPGVILDPIGDLIEVTFQADVTDNGGPLTAVAEVVGDCGNPLITPACVFTNIWGEAPLANSMTGSVLGAVNGQYHSFDQDRFAAAGHLLTKTVRYDEEGAGAAGTNRNARVGEDLIYRIEAVYFGGEFSNVTITDSLPAELGFGTPTAYAFTGGITNAVWDPGTGVFTLQPAVLATNPSTFAVDIPVVVSNRLDVQDGVVITNTATTAFTLDGVTNIPVERTTEVAILEPVLQITKSVNSNLVQEGDIILFTNRLVHTAASRTSAYSIVFTDTLPAGLVFSAFVSPATGDVAGQTITFNTNHLAALGEFKTNDAPIEFVFAALVTNQLVGAQITNRSSATYVSLDHPSENGNERDGADGTGGLNNYYTESAVVFAAQPVKALAKTFVSSSQTNTLDGATNDWTIGERFVYEIRVDVPQGVVSNLVLTDTVPSGIDWVGGNTNAGLSYPGRGYEFAIPAGGPQFPTNAGAGLTITDTDPTPNSSTSTDGSGLPVVFTFGAITNGADGDLGNDYFTLRLEFVALSQAVNVGTNPTPRRGSNVVSAADAFTTLGATGPVYRIVEHDVRARKLRSSATNDAGDVMTFTLIASNQVNALANAYDVMVADTLSSNVYDFATFTFDSVTPGWDAELIGTTGGRIYRMFATNNTPLPPNSGATGVFSVALAQGVRPNQIYTNRMDITNATTLYGDPPGGISERNDTANNSTNFRVPGLAIAKTLDATSETNNPPDSTGSNVQIGEVATYRLAITLPESTITNLTVVDTISANGLSYIFGSVRLDTAGFAGNAGDVVESPAGAADTLSAMGQQMTFTFTNVVVTGDNDTNNNAFYLLADYLVLSNAVNDGLPPGVTVHTNRATLTYGGNPGAVVTSAVVTTTVIEPQLQIFKSLAPTSHVDAGDIVSVTLTVTNAGTAAAYDVAIEDELALPYFDIGTLANVVLPTGYVYEVAGDVFRILSDTNAPTGTNTIEPGEALVFTFDVQTAGALPPNVVVTNVATVLGDSLASTNLWDQERFTGHTNAATFTADDFDPTKILYATSETGPADSAGADLQIGEIATYEISVGLPEGTITDLQITDVLPAGMAYVVGSLTVLTNDLDGTLAPATNVAPNVPPLGASGEDVVITFTGDTVMNATTNPSGNILHLRLDAVVLDLPANVGLAPQTVLTNSASVTYAGNPNPPATVIGPPVTLIEPDIAVSKTVAPDRGDAGDEITVTLVATNRGLATAYDLVIEDVLDGAVFDTASVTNISMPAGFVFAAVPGPADVTVSYVSDTNSYQATNTLEVGESLQFVFTAHLAQAVEPGALYTNGVSIAADTIYATNAVGIQRGDTNAAQDTLSISNMVIAKALAGTSETGVADTTGDDVTIGERATYRLTVTLPEATITNLAVADIVPAGMSYVPLSVSVDTAGFGGSLPGAPAVATLGGSGDDVTFTFEGLTVVTNNNDGSDNSFAIEFDLLALDEAGNDGLPAGVDGDGMTVLPNSATVAYDGNPPVSTSGVVNVDVVEPRLAITKTMSEASNSVVVINLVVTNRGLSTAFDVEIEDVLTTAWWDTDTIAPVTVPDGFTFNFTGNPGDATITIATDPASQPPTNCIEVGESLLFRFRATLIDGAPSPVTNTAEVTEHSTLDGDDPDERDEPPVQDEDVLAIPGYTLSKVLTSPLGRPAEVGETVTFDIVVANTGDIGLEPVLLEDTYDTTYLSYGAAVPASVDNNDDGTVNWTNVGPVAVGGSVTVAVEFVAIESTYPGDTTNRVVASPFTTNGLPLLPKTNEAPVEVVYVGYTLEKDRTSPAGRAAQVGEPIVFTITVVNTGEVALATLPVEDTYDTTYLTYGSAVPASDDNNNDGTINWADIGPLPVGASTTIVATFTAAASTLGLSETNTVVASPTTVGAPPVYPKTNDAPYEIHAAGYTIEKTRIFPPGRPAIIGETVLFLVSVVNTGDVDLVTVPVQDLYETNYLTYVSSVPASDNDDNDGVIDWADIGPIAVGDSADILMAFTAAGDTLGADRTNVVATAPTTPTNAPPVPPKTNDAPYAVDTPAALGDYVWEDVDGDGVQDGGEPAVSNVVVTLYDAATNALGVTTTDVAGAYAFTNLVPDTYFVGFAPPPGWQLTLRDQGGDDALDSDADQITGYTIPTVLISGENDPTWDAGLIVGASLGDFVWNDLDADGIQDGGETGVVGVVVNLLTNGTVIASTTTDVNGAYAFIGLPPWDYQVQVVAPAGWYVSPQDQGADDAADSDIDTGTGLAAVTTLVSGENDPTWDAGLYLPASLGDYVWEDVDGDGVQDGGEPAVPGVVVTLYDAATNALGVTTTDVAGAYAFTNLVPDTYFVGFAPPAGWQLTLQDRGGNDALDSDADQITGYTAPTVLSSGENDPTWDAGVYRPASLGDFVWDDLDADGVQDGGEVGVANVTVNLLTNGTVIASTTTDVSGAYAFTNLPPWDYQVQVVAPAGWYVSPQDQGADDAADSDIDTGTGLAAVTTLVSGENDPTWDAGLYLPASLGDYVWEDVDGDGVQDGGEPAVPGVVVTLYDAATNALGVTTTDVAGAYAFTNLVPDTYFVGFAPPAGWQLTLQDRGGNDALDSDADQITGYTIPTVLFSGENDPTWDAGLYRPASLGDFVWDDLDADGIQDGGETGVPNVVVNLLTNGTVIASTTTDVSGAYAFTNLPPWDYQVQVVAPAGWYVSPQDQGADDAADSDIDPVTGLAAVTTLVSGENDPTWDAGLYLPASLGDYVWEDVDGDGVQGGAGETGMPDVVVTLYDAATNALGVTTTDVAGAYAFTNLVPGTYFVGFAPPAGWQLTLRDQGGDDALDSDADQITGYTIPTVLISGENDPTWDAGVYRPASLGDFVWDDLDADGVQDGGETGVPNVVVNLLTNGTVIASTTTDVSGAYAFTNLPPWDYQVQVVVPAGWYVSPQDQGADDAADSDIDTGTGLAAVTTLVSGENDPTWDAGLYLPASLGDYVWEDVDGDGVQDGGEPAVPGVVVTLYDAATNALGVTTTDVAGAYAFTNLVPGTYFAGFAPPAGWQITLQDRGGDDALDSDADQITGYTIPTVLISGENDPTWDAGVYRPASLGDFVWDDLNADGVQDGGETGVPNVVVNLLTNGTVIASTTTDVSGAYAFTNLPPWDYQVQVVAPAGWYVSPQDQGADDAADSDIDTGTGLAAVTTLVSGENDPTWDAGLYLPASLGDFIWLDTDGNGIQDAGEAGLPNILVDLYAGGGAWVAATTTDVNGAYAFTNLVPGDYYIDVDVPAGWFTSPPNQGGNGALDSDIDSAGSTATTTLISGENDPTWDGGLSLPASLGDYVWEDRNYNGIQDAGEPGIPNVTVRLYTGDSNLVATTTTDANGLYLFPNLPAGPYFVQFARPAGYQPTLSNRGGNDAVDSDASQTTGNTTVTALWSGENDLTWDAGFYRPASVGDYVWLDEDWDGVQDPGEAGLANVRMQLLNTNGTVVATTWTDVNGLYLFADLQPGTYTVRVATNTLAAGLAANQTFDPDVVRNHQTTVTLASGDAIRTADFGYNWAPSTGVAGAIGDRVWVDDDADGVQDAGEPGIPGVRVYLYTDGAADGTYATRIATTTTDAAGFYVFTNLPAGGYAVRVDTNTLPANYTQTGDPDTFGTTLPAGQGDHRTTQPVVLAPGDVFVNADFGYWFPTSSNLGDLIYFDANANGAYSAASGDYGIPGVTVALLNGAGKIIASTVTDSTGWYLFTGLPAGTYTVWVNDSANVLANLVQTGDPDGGLDSRSTATLDGRTDNLLQDHGYTPDGHGPLLGLIGDTVFLDRDGNGLPGTGEGLQGVTVRLYDSPGFALLATTVTDPNGRYYFGGLPAMTYTVRVDTNTLPNGGVGLRNSVDPDTPGTGNSQSLVTIGPGGINLLQDFGYVPLQPNAIGGTLWRDCDADGVLDSSETPRWAGVQIVLRNAASNIVGTTFTDANGNYQFSRLPGGTYSVDVNDVSNRLHGFWQSLGPNPGADNNSQRKPYAVTVTGGQTNTTGDFGYYLVIAELGDYVWYDINGNGLQDGGEPGLSGVTVTLKIRYPNSTQITLQTKTDASGRYLFANLLLDERYSESTTNNPTVAGLPRFQVSIVSTQRILTADGYVATRVNAGSGSNDSREHSGTFAMLRKCGRPVTYDFGYKGGPLLAVIGSVSAFTRDGQTIVQWETIESWGTAGFYLEREVGGEWVRISPELLPFPIFGVAPIIYEEVDPGAQAGGTYVYRLVELENDGDLLTYGPYTLTVNGAGRTYADWAAAHFTAAELANAAISGANADPDGDRLTNGQEFLAWTDPKSADSVLQVTEVRRVEGGLELSWRSIAGRFYKIAVSDSMFGPFLPLEESILATDETGSVVLPVDFQDRQMYFQVILVGGAGE